jgi:hypothetical protein
MDSSKNEENVGMAAAAREERKCLPKPFFLRLQHVDSTLRLISNAIANCFSKTTHRWNPAGQSQRVEQRPENAIFSGGF